MGVGDKIFLVVMYVITLIPFLIFIYSSIHKKRKMEAIDFFNVYYLLVYFIVPIFFFFNNHSVFERKYSGFLEYDLRYHILALLIAMTFIILVNFFYKKIKCKTRFKSVKIDVGSKKFFFLNIIFSVIGIVSYYLWSKVYGFPFGIIQYAPEIRDGVSTINNPFTYFQPLTLFVVFASYNWLVLFRKYSSATNKIIALCLFVVTFFFGALSVFATDGRATIILFFLVPVLFLLISKRFSFNKILIIGLIAVFALGEMDVLTQSFRSDSYQKQGNTNIAEVVSYEFGFTYANRINLLYNIEHEDVYVSEWEDLQNIVFSWVPKSMKPKNLRSLSDYNTSMYDNPSGAIPTDVVTAALYKGRLFGVLLLSIFLAFVLKFFDSNFSYRKDDFSKMFTLYFCVAITLTMVAYYDLSALLFNKLAFLIYYLVIFVVCRERRDALIETNDKYREIIL